MLDGGGWENGKEVWSLQQEQERIVLDRPARSSFVDEMVVFLVESKKMKNIKAFSIKEEFLPANRFSFLVPTL